MSKTDRNFFQPIVPLLLSIVLRRCRVLSNNNGHVRFIDDRPARTVDTRVALWAWLALNATGYFHPGLVHFRRHSSVRDLKELRTSPERHEKKITELSTVGGRRLNLRREKSPIGNANWTANMNHDHKQQSIATTLK